MDKDMAMVQEDVVAAPCEGKSGRAPYVAPSLERLNAATKTEKINYPGETTFAGHS